MSTHLDAAGLARGKNRKIRLVCQKARAASARGARLADFGDHLSTIFFRKFGGEALSKCAGPTLDQGRSLRRFRRFSRGSFTSILARRGLRSREGLERRVA